MIFALYSEINDSTIQSNLGRPQYSYYFLLKSFRVVFESLGEVVIIEDPASEVDQLYDDCRSKNQTCLFVCFTPPYLAPTFLRCPTVCLFAWEFSTVPCASWNQNPAHDWRYVFTRHAGVITTSNYTANIVSDVLRSSNETVPVLAIPSPIWDDFAALRGKDPLAHLNSGSTIPVSGFLQDTDAIDFDLGNLLPRYFVTPKLYSIQNPNETTASNGTRNWRARIESTRKHWRNWYDEVFKLQYDSGSVGTRADEQATNQAIESLPLDLSGVVYTTILNPEDGRKCHIDILSAFIWAFRNNSDVTLVMKMLQQDADGYRMTLNHTLHQLYPFKCRVIIFNGYLNAAEYQSLIDASTYYVNTSHCEGLCLPLMEFLSSGKPVIAPDHTAMRDYINEEIAFVIETNKETNVWPHDPTGHYTTERYRNNWETIVRQYLDSYRIATEDQGKYRSMSNAAKQAMAGFCSFESVQRKMQTFVNDVCGL